MTDTHTHIYLPEFAGEEEATFRRALDAGVGRLVFPNVDMDSLQPMLDLSAAHPAETVVAIGLHPTSVDASWRETLEQIKAASAHVKPAAIGEVGMDLYWDKTWRAEQMEAFAHQVQWALDLDIPVIIHCREALPETLEVLRSFGGRLPRLVFHSFTGSPDDVRAIRQVCPDAYFGINGVVTFKNAASLREALPEIGIDHILLETDSPYLAPVPHRGKRNESAYLPAVCAKVAEVLGIDAGEVERITDASASRLFYQSETP